MTRKERIKRCIHFKETDCIPWQVNCTSSFADRLLASLGHDPIQPGSDPLGIRKQGLLDEYLGNHIVYVRNRGVNSVREVRPGIWKDEWGVLWDRSIDRDIGTPANSPLESGRIQDMVPDPDDPDRYAHVEPIIESAGDRYVLSKFSYNLFERAWSLRGFEALLLDCAGNPSLVHEIMQSITDFNLRVMDNLTQYAIDGIQFGDDWGSQTSLLISPAMWREFVRPYAETMFAHAHRLGYDVFIHSCGRVTPILEDIVQMGTDVFNPLQPEVLPVEEIMEQYAGRLAFYGSISIQKTLPFGTEAEVQREVQRRIETARACGGLILSPAHDVPPDVPVGNLIALLDVVRGQ
jgi:uroporphyrinogen decarboxylase